MAPTRAFSHSLIFAFSATDGCLVNFITASVVVFRLGIAPTRAAARQLVSHKHITVDGEVVNIPSYAVKPGQLIGVRERSKSLEVIANSLAGFNHSKYPWLEWDDNSKVGKLLHVPERADIPENIKEHLIVELYSK